MAFFVFGHSVIFIYLLYNVYRRGRDYEHDNREKSSAVVHSKSVNSDPYFRSWNTLANNTLGST